VRGRGVTLGLRHERWVYAILALAYLTGIAWIALHYGPADNGPDGAWRAVESWALRLHGAASMAALVVVGSLLAQHVPTAWRLRRNLASGIAMLAGAAALAVTGWLLYYAAGEGIRQWSSYLHMATGGAGPLALLWHLAYQRRLARARRRSSLHGPGALRDEAADAQAIHARHLEAPAAPLRAVAARRNAPEQR
jgi:MFS family permease